jgi:PAS domain S-box-containing protein
VLRDTLADLRRRNTEISALLGCARSVLEHKDFRKAASAIVQECRAIVGGSAGYFARTQSDGTVEDAFFVDTHGAPRDLKAPAPLVGLPRDVWSTGQGGISNKTTSADAREPAIGELLGVESSLCVPLVLDSTVVGLLGIVNKAGGFDENDLRVATGFAEIAAVALRNSETSRLLEQSEELYRTLVEAITDAVDVKDADLRYAIVNSEQLRRFGRSQEEVVGKTLEEIVGKARAGKYSADDWQVLATGETMESESAFPDSRLPLICLNTRVPLRDKSGSVIGVVTVSRDITERKRTHDQLLRAQRLETAGRIAGQVAHDFNNLLAPLALYPDLIKLSLSEGHPASRHLNAMLEIVQQMAQINANLLAMGRRGRMELQPVDLNSLLRHSLTEIVEVPSALRTEVELEPALWTVQGSSSQLLRVVSNLIANAREAMQDCGILTLRTENVAIDGIQGQYGSIPAGEYVLLTVADTGCGISVEHRDRIFDAFFTTKDSARRGGSGLGLSIVLSVISDHGGYVDLESEPGKGTGFFVYLPASRTRKVEAGKKAVAQGTEKVLVVDDEAPQREAVTQLLARLGYDAHAVSSGEEAVEFVKKHSVDLIVLDIFMPGGMNGVDTLREMREIRPNQKAVIISGYVDAEVARKARSLGIANYVHKPVTLDKLARTIREALDGKVELDPTEG